MELDFSPYTIQDGLSKIKDMMPIENMKSNKRICYYNIPCAFDIETSSFYENGEKRACMYVWQFGFNGVVIMGRTWPEFIKFMDDLCYLLSTSVENRLVVYVHNLSFEFQWMRKWFDWENVFATDERKPLYALTKSGIEFRCSYLLTGVSLEKLGDYLLKYKVEKASGDLDYTKIRHTKTPLTEKEIGYCVRDVLVVMAYIQECIDKEKYVFYIPATKTGYARRYCRSACLYTKGKEKVKTYKYQKYHAIMKCLSLTVDEYDQLKRAFQGGFTHANAFYSETTQKDVASFDFTSSYPAVMVAEKFPMSRGEYIGDVTMDVLERYCLYYCCLFDIEFTDIYATTIQEHYISMSKCWNVASPAVDNGRIVEAERLTITITEQDYYIIKGAYMWGSATVKNLRIYRRGYLPTDFVKSVLKLYVDKTTLKDVDGEEERYLLSKELLNSLYGMCVTDICRFENTYIEDWKKEAPDKTEAIAKYNRSSTRFISYAWGVWVTAYARRNLWSGIFSCGTDYIYSDTDSIKVLNVEKHWEYINKYNDDVKEKINRACLYHDINPNDTRPKTIKGKIKPLGFWDFEGVMDRFRTIGAKRYLVDKNGKIILTVSGVKKVDAVGYLLKKYGHDGIFDVFDDGLEIPENYTGKLTHGYIDCETAGNVVDYLGQKNVYHEYSSVHLEKAAYNTSLGKDYIKFLRGIRTIEG